MHALCLSEPRDGARASQGHPAGQHARDCKSLLVIPPVLGCCRHWGRHCWHAGHAMTWTGRAGRRPGPSWRVLWSRRQLQWQRGGGGLPPCQRIFKRRAGGCAGDLLACGVHFCVYLPAPATLAAVLVTWAGRLPCWAQRLTPGRASCPLGPVEGWGSSTGCRVGPLTCESSDCWLATGRACRWATDYDSSGGESWSAYCARAEESCWRVGQDMSALVAVGSQPCCGLLPACCLGLGYLVTALCSPRAGPGLACCCFGGLACLPRCCRILWHLQDASPMPFLAFNRPKACQQLGSMGCGCWRSPDRSPTLW